MKDTVHVALHPLWAGCGTMLALLIALPVFAMVTGQPWIWLQIIVFAVACGGIVGIIDWIRRIGPRASN